MAAPVTVAVKQTTISNGGCNKAMNMNANGTNKNKRVEIKKALVNSKAESNSSNYNDSPLHKSTCTLSVHNMTSARSSLLLDGKEAIYAGAAAPKAESNSGNVLQLPQSKFKRL
jgi:hypothetical protein